MTDFTIVFNNEKIFNFYKKTQLNPENINLLFIDVLDRLLTGIDKSDEYMTSKLLEQMKSLDSKIETINSSLKNDKLESSLIFNSKISEYRADYINEMRMILSANNNDYIAPLIKETNGSLIDKTSLLINELRNQDNISTHINTQFTLFQSAVIAETNKLMSSSLDKPSIEEFFKTINQTMTQSQGLITTIITSSESRIDNRLLENERKLNEIKEISTVNQQSQSTLQTNVSELLKKFGTSSSRGNASENILYNILLNLFPDAQIDQVGDIKETGDIMLNRTDKPQILIENKDHTSRNVPKLEVEKFIRDCDIQNCCGIMFAQHKGIANKQNFELQMNGNNILLYVHETNFDIEKIRIAIEIVEHMKLKVDELSSHDSDIVIDKLILDEINKEFILIVNQKSSIIKTVKDFSDKMVIMMNEIKLPNLEKYLSSKFAHSTNIRTNTCEFCGKMVAKSMLQHHRYCAAKKENVSITLDK